VRDGATTLTIGASHRTATAATLGEITRAALGLERRIRDESGRRGRVPVRELAVLATCGRAEVYAACDRDSVGAALAAIGEEVFGSRLIGVAYERTGTDTVRHAARVAAGLDSMVLGEHEIAGQLTRALRGGVRLAGEGAGLEEVATVAATASRRTRAETGIGRGAASVSSAAVDIAAESLGGLEGRRALVVGAGRAGLAAARTLASLGVASLTVANRSYAQACRVARAVGGEPAALEDLAALLADVDVAVTATRAEHVVVDFETARRAAAARAGDARPLLLVDIAVPADVAPEVYELEGIQLVTLDDVARHVETRLATRRRDVAAAEEIIDEVVREHERRRGALDVERRIGELRRGVEGMRAREVERWLSRRGDDVPGEWSREELDRLTRSIVNKALHASTAKLRSGGGRPEDEWELRAAVDDLFERELRPFAFREQ